MHNIAKGCYMGGDGCEASPGHCMAVARDVMLANEPLGSM